MSALTPIRERIRTAPHGRKWIERVRRRDLLHACLAKHLKNAPHPLDEAARRAVEGR